MAPASERPFPSSFERQRQFLALGNRHGVDRTALVDPPEIDSSGLTASSLSVALTAIFFDGFFRPGQASSMRRTLSVAVGPCFGQPLGDRVRHA